MAASWVLISVKPEQFNHKLREDTMSNIVPSNIQIPAHLARLVGKTSALSAALAGGLSGAADFPRISIKGSRFRIVEGGAETVLEDTKLSIIVVGANPRLSKSYYAKQWTPDAEPSSPDCFSLNGLRPHPDSTDPQHSTCAGCPMDAWGSKITPMGTKIKACADQKRLAVVASNDPSGPTYLLQITPAALKSLSAYQKELSMRGIPVEAVKTVISFDTDASFPKLTFKYGGFLDEDEYAAVEKLFDSANVLDITGERETEPVAEVAPAPKPNLVAEKPKAAAPAPAPVADEPKRGFGAAKAAPEVEEEEAPKPKAAVKAAPKAAVKVDTKGGGLHDEIASLMADMDSDD
jgi:hypothetical protein